jgi:phage shock protein A
MALKGGAVPPYGVAIHQAIAQGDLQRMKTVASEAEAHLRQYGDVRSALEVLKTEIAKLEQKKS